MQDMIDLPINLETDDSLLFSSPVSKKEFLSERKFYSPGPVPSSEILNIYYSHRSDSFRQDIYDVVSNLGRMVSNKYNVALIQGSSTSGIECAISSTVSKDSLFIGLDNGIFGARAMAIAKQYTSNIIECKTIDELEDQVKKNGNKNPIVFAVQFETSCSKYNEICIIQDLKKDYDFTFIVDAISAFPYYATPDCDLFIVSSAKQLRGLPVMGIVFYKSNIIDSLVENNFYLSLKRYIEYGKRFETPNTSLMPQVISLKKHLRGTNFTVQNYTIRENCKALHSDILNKYIINEKYAPVITFGVTKLDILLDSFESYNIFPYFNKSYMGNILQISTFNYTDINYYKILYHILTNHYINYEENK
jgi:hypothetical protein